MPEIFRVGGFKFCIYLKDHLPPHVHVYKDGAHVKIDLLTLECIRSKGFDELTLRRIQRIVADTRNILLKAWYEKQDEE
jgi:hypothetical protein